jgi:hypothetical protein
VRALAAREADLHLDPAVLEVGAQREHGQAALRDAAHELQDLALVQQQLARAVRGVVVQVAVAVGGDAAPHQQQLAVARLDVGVLELEPAGADRLDLGPDEHDAGLRALQHLVVEERLPVRRQRALALLGLGHDSML